ncbi:hypothetical protein BLOT_008757 [Blomia tropicalis]|nr:hypothetical protein BLOT_008757 [Blomia tropicalis]
MCLRLVGLRREIVETESSHSQTQTHKPKTNIDINKGCLVIRQIVIPLRRSSSQVYLFLVVRNHFQIFNSIPLIAKSNSSYLEFTINGIFEQLEPSFQIKVEIYQMDLTTMQATLMKPIYKSLWNKTKPNNWWKCTKKLKSALSKQNQLEVVPNNTYNFEIRSVQKIETDKLAIVGSAFKLVGSFIWIVIIGKHLHKFWDNSIALGVLSMIA